MLKTKCAGVKTREGKRAGPTQAREDEKKGGREGIPSEKSQKAHENSRSGQTNEMCSVGQHSMSLRGTGGVVWEFSERPSVREDRSVEKKTLKMQHRGVPQKGKSPPTYKMGRGGIGKGQGEIACKKKRIL